MEKASPEKISENDARSLEMKLAQDPDTGGWPSRASTGLSPTDNIQCWER